MTWSTKSSAGTKTNISATPQNFDPVSLALGIGSAGFAVCQIKVDFGSSTNELRVGLFSTLDISSEDWDSAEFFAFNVTPGQPIVSLAVKDRYRFRATVSRVAGGNDELITSATLHYRTELL